jgi:hypothetical protein
MFTNSDVSSMCHFLYLRVASYEFVEVLKNIFGNLLTSRQYPTVNYSISLLDFRSSKISPSTGKLFSFHK